MAKRVVPVSENKKRFTKREREQRLAAERALATKPISVRCPGWLDEIGKKEWRRLVREAREIGLLGNLDVGALAICCDCYSKYVTATSKINETTLVGVHTNRAGEKNLVVNPFVRVAQGYADRYRQYCVELGLTPSSRLKMTTRLRVETDEPQEPTAFEQMFGNVVPIRREAK